MIFAAVGAKLAAAAPRSRLSAEQGIKKIAVRRIARARTAEFKAGVPIGRRAKVFAGAMLAQLIVCRALLGALEHLIGLADLFEPRLGVFFFADVRMIFAGEFAIGLLDLCLGCVARNAHHLVIILKFHSSPANGNAQEYYV